MNYLWYRNTFWWVVLCFGFIMVYTIAKNEFDWDLKFLCGYIFAQLYFTKVRKE